MKHCKEFRKEHFKIKLVFISFKIKNYFSHKDPVPDNLKSFLAYKFTCASCSSSYIGKTGCRFKTRIGEHIKKDNKCHTFKHLHFTATCFDSYGSLCFKIIDKDNSKFDLKIKEALHINWRKLNLNAQQNHLALILSLYLLFPVALFCLYLFFAFLFHLLFSLSLTLIIGIFYCLNYTSLLLYIVITHLVSHLSLSSIIFIISTLIICIFYCLNYTSLLLRLIITHFINVFYDNYGINICSRQLLWFVQVSLIFVLISWLEKDHSMMETRRLKNVIFFQTILIFMLLRKILLSSSGFLLITWNMLTIG